MIDKADDNLETFSWKEHQVLVGDGKGGYLSQPAEYQFLPRFGAAKVVPFGLAKMDNSEILLLEQQRPIALPSKTARRQLLPSVRMAGRHGAIIRRLAMVAPSC